MKCRTYARREGLFIFSYSVTVILPDSAIKNIGSEFMSVPLGSVTTLYIINSPSVISTSPVFNAVQRTSTKLPSGSLKSSIDIAATYAEAGVYSSSSVISY